MSRSSEVKQDQNVYLGFGWWIHVFKTEFGKESENEHKVSTVQIKEKKEARKMTKSLK